MPIRLFGFTLVLLGMVSFAFAKNGKTTEQEICPGITYLHKTVPEVPWSIHALRIERNRPELQIVTTLSGGEFISLTRLSDQVKFIPKELGKPIGGINGDFFRWQVGPYQGDVGGLHIVNGELASAPNYFEKQPNVRGSCAFWIDKNDEPRISFISSQFKITWPDRTTTRFGVNEERADDQMVLYNHFAGLTTKTTNGIELVLERKRGFSPIRVGEVSRMVIREVRGPNTVLISNSVVLSIGPKVAGKMPRLKAGMPLEISTVTTPDISGTSVAVGGGPVLVQKGKVVKIPHEQERHPRAALGVNEKYFFFVAVDGRRPGISEGMTCQELAQEMVRWKCLEAMNIDGGASAMLWVEGKIMNLPSENRERPNANSLFVLRRLDASPVTKTSGNKNE